jgi:hypothetical protein
MTSMTSRSMIELSNNHIHPEDIREITRLSNGEWDSAYVGTFGIMVWTGYCDSAQCPKRIRQTLGLARDAYKVDYIMFDRDAPDCTLFATFSDAWE